MRVQPGLSSRSGLLSSVAVQWSVPSELQVRLTSSWRGPGFTNLTSQSLHVVGSAPGVPVGVPVSVLAETPLVESKLILISPTSMRRHGSITCHFDLDKENPSLLYIIC